MHVENQGSDRPAHSHSLIRAFSACKVLDMMKVKDKKTRHQNWRSSHCAITHVRNKKSNI